MAVKNTWKVSHLFGMLTFITWGHEACATRLCYTRNILLGKDDVVMQET